MDITRSKYKILSILKVPPPITGATLSNLRFLNSAKINESFNFNHIKISYANSVSNLGKLSIKKGITFITLIYNIITTLINFKPQLVYFQISPKGIAFIRDFFVVLILKIFNKQIVYHIRAIGLQSVADKSTILRILYKLTFRNSYIICFSELVKDDLKQLYKGTPIAIPNGLVPTIPENQLQLDKDNDTIKILFISNYLESKGVFDIIDAAYKIKSKKFEITMIGAISDQNVYDTMLYKIQNLNLESTVYVVGEKYDQDKIEYLLQSDIFVFPTLNEGFGNVALEAMEASLPVIAYNEGSLPYIIKDNVTGFIVPKHNINALTKKIELLIQNKELRINMGKAGRKRFLELFTIETFENKIVNIFNQILSNE